MRHLYLLLFVAISFNLNAQQDALFTSYQFNTSTFNPAYVGNKGYLTTTLIHRAQWLGWNTGGDSNAGAPRTQSLSLHAPVSDKIGLGLHLLTDVIGPTRTQTFNVAYAYKIPLEIGTLSLGIHGGMYNWRADWQGLSFKDSSNDPAFEGLSVKQVIPNFGAGAYFQAKQYYVGLSVPRLLRLAFPPNGAYDAELKAQNYRTYYFIAGGVIPVLSTDILFKPSILIRKTGLFEVQPSAAAPATVDIDASMLFLETLWIGLSYRAGNGGNSMSLSAANFFPNGLRVGIAYDYSLNELQSHSASSSIELMVGYDFHYRVGRVQSPRYF